MSRGSVYYRENKEKCLAKMKERNARPEVKARRKAYAEKYRQSGRATERYWVRTYGLAEGEYETLLAQQNGVCALCGRPETKKGRTAIRRLAVDHCHETGRVRGLLCFDCNVGLGHFEDNVDRLLDAVTYLKRGDSG